MINAQIFIATLNQYINPKKSKLLSRFFKTAIGQYGHGDRFLGIDVPTQRKLIKPFKNLPLRELKKILHSNVHEQRFSALAILLEQFKKASQQQKQQLFEFYLKNLKWINNWDLVDVSAPHIVGEMVFIQRNNIKLLRELIKSPVMWHRRVAVLSTFYFIRKNEYWLTLEFAQELLKDDQDLMHKAVGWMLREVGKRDQSQLTAFLDRHAPQMPRTMLRYAIEKLKPLKRQRYLALKKR